VAAWAAPSTALVGGKWLNGVTFDHRTAYNVEGCFTYLKRTRVDRILDLSGTWILYGAMKNDVSRVSVSG